MRGNWEKPICLDTSIPQLLGSSILHSCEQTELVLWVSLTRASLGFLEFSVLEKEVAVQH